MEDIAAPLYPTIDWANSVIGGSHALQQYTQDRTWKPADIDIPCNCATHGDFLGHIARFKSYWPGAGCTLKLRSDEERLAQSRGHSGPDEKFHESIIATATCTIPGIAVPVQFIGITSSAHFLGRAPLIEHLDRITDLPACVNYTVDLTTGKRNFHVPERAVVPLATRHIPKFGICLARMDKYRARGYTFDE